MTGFASTRYPQVAKNPMAIAMLATALHAEGRHDEAFALAVEARELAPEDMEIRDIIAASFGRGVPKWHVPMLNDDERNRCYGAALEAAIKPGMRVLEIGTGGGFLSLIAARAGAEVITCECNTIVAAAAKLISARNGFADRIRVIPKISSSLQVGTDLPGRADLLMSELFDDTLYGDGLVSFIADARDRLLKPDARIIPPRAELRCALVSFEMPPKHKPLQSVEGFDMSPFNVLAPRSSTHLRSAKLATTPRSDALPALSLDFHSRAPFGATRSELHFRSRGGSINGIAQWLRIDFGGGIEFENDPFQKKWSHWGAPIVPFVRPLDTAAGDRVTVSVRRVGRDIFFKAESRDREALAKSPIEFKTG